MAIITVFDPTSKRSQQINITLQSAVVDTDGDARLDYFVHLSTSARKISGAEIPPKIIRRLIDLVRKDSNGDPEYQHDGVTDTPYASMSKAIEDYILNMVEGDGGADAMSFSS